ncbi:MAG: hypothetical protein A2X32_12660 [Elusimicrobia bacterium GWC2_64_44]|nr:MAG: hypothetical protein A2X32_12660 [Elusimicrobia bacterium GWC2_64_44]
MTQYAALLKDPLAPLLAPEAFLAGRPGSGRDPAQRFLRANPGFLGRNLPLEAARELSEAAGLAGFGTLLVPEGELPAPPMCMPAEKLEFKGNGFSAKLHGAVIFIPYDSITVIAAAAWDAEASPDTVQALAPGLFAKIAALAGAPLPPVPAAPKETFFRADIIGGEGPLRLTLRPEALDFAPLGPARSPSSLINFRLLLDKLVTPSFGAVHNSFLPAFLASVPLAPHKFASPEAADLSLSRLLLLSSPK